MSAAAYGIFGTDTYLAEEALEKLLAQAVGADRGESVTVLRGPETSWAAIADAARSRSLFAPRRAVVVRAAEALKGDGAELLAYLESPAPDAVLVFMGRPDGRKLPWKRLAGALSVIKADPLRGRALDAKIAEELRRRGLRLAEDAYEELRERVGQDLRRLVGEIEKLLAFADGKKTLAAEDVAAVLGRGVTQPIYMLGDAFMKREAGRALRILQEALDDGEPALVLLSNLHRSVRTLRKVKALAARRASPRQIADRLELGNRAFLVPQMVEAARRWTEGELEAATAALARADQRMKTSADPRWVLAAAVGEAYGRGEATPGAGRAR